MSKISIGTIFNYYSNGLKLAFSKECRVYIIIPIIVNFVLLCSVGYFLYSSLHDLVFSIFETFSGYFLFIAYIISFILSCLIIFSGCYFFSTLATILASPFYGLLSEKVENLVSGNKLDDTGFADIIKDIPRILKREIKKQFFFLTFAIPCLILYFIPVINIIAPVLWFLLTCWMGCLQYCDYAFDNHKISFAATNQDLKNHSFCTLCFGAIISLSLAVPIINIFMPPATVCAGTLYYLDLRTRN